MAEGRSNQAICDRLFLAPKTVEAHIANIFSKLELLPAPDDHRRVLAVLALPPRLTAGSALRAALRAAGLPRWRTALDGEHGGDQAGLPGRTVSRPEYPDVPSTARPDRRTRSPSAPAPLLLVQQLVMASFLDRSQIEATMASPLYLPSAVAYFLAFCGLLVALVAAYSWEAEEAGTFGVVGVPRRPRRHDVPGRRPVVRGVRRAVARRRRTRRRSTWPAGC